jgi:hypothetical protein
LHECQLLYLHDVGIVPPHALVVVLELRVWAHMPAGAGLVVRGGDFSC